MIAFPRQQMCQRQSSPPGMDRETILRALELLSEKLKARGAIGELCIFGGTVMVLAYAARVSTKDVDALFQPAQLIRDLAGEVAREQDLSGAWLNDGVKGFVSAKHDLTAANLPQFANLRLTMPTAEYLLAMKCMASRLGGASGEPSDVPDIVFLLRHLGIRNAQAALEIVAQYYPPNRIPVKTQYLLEGLYDEGKI